MASQLPNASGCCTCDTNPVVVQIPGPQGPAGSNGSNGTNGVNAYCTTTAQFTVPNTNFTVTISVDSTSFLPASAATQQAFVYVGNAGYFQVVSFTSNSILIKAIQAVAAGTVVPIGQIVDLVGPRGVTGSAGGGAPSTSTYVINTADASLPNAQILASLATGYAKVTTATGIISTVSTISASDISGVLAATKGGTGIGGYSIGDIISASGASSLTRVSPGTAGYPLVSNGAGFTPGYAQLNLGVGATGILNVSNGGTGSSTAAGARTNLGLGNVFNPQYLGVYMATLENGWTVPIASGGGLGTAIFVSGNQTSTTISQQSEAAFNVTNGKYTPTTTGLYLVTCTLYVRPSAGTRTYTGQILLNAALTGIVGRVITTNAYSACLSFTGIVKITVANSDYIQAAIFADSAAVNSVFEAGSSLTITKISA